MFGFSSVVAREETLSLSMAARRKDETAKLKEGGQYGSAGLGDGPGKLARLASGNLKRFRAWTL